MSYFLQIFRMTFRVLDLFRLTLAALLTTRPRREEILQSIVQIGVGSLPLIALTTVFAGLIVTNEIAWHMDKALHTTEMIPGFTAQFVIRELGIAIPAILLVSKVGASITAEVSTMKISEQIEALRLLGIDPVRYLVVPRFVASILSGACLTLITIGITLAFAIGVAVVSFHFSVMEYLNALRHFVGFQDLVGALVKGMVFGAVIPVISCAYGFECKGGADGVGSATTDSVVASTATIITLDFVLTYLFTSGMS